MRRAVMAVLVVLVLVSAGCNGTGKLPLPVFAQHDGEFAAVLAERSDAVAVRLDDQAATLVQVAPVVDNEDVRQKVDEVARLVTAEAVHVRGISRDVSALGRGVTATEGQVAEMVAAMEHQCEEYEARIVKLEADLRDARDEHRASSMRAAHWIGLVGMAAGAVGFGIGIVLKQVRIAFSLAVCGGALALGSLGFVFLSTTLKWVAVGVGVVSIGMAVWLIYQVFKTGTPAAFVKKIIPE